MQHATFSGAEDYATGAEEGNYYWHGGVAAANMF